MCYIPYWLRWTDQLGGFEFEVQRCYLGCWWIWGDLYISFSSPLLSSYSWGTTDTGHGTRIHTGGVYEVNNCKRRVYEEKRRKRSNVHQPIQPTPLNPLSSFSSLYQSSHSIPRPLCPGLHLHLYRSLSWKLGAGGLGMLLGERRDVVRRYGTQTSLVQLLVGLDFIAEWLAHRRADWLPFLMPWRLSVEMECRSIEGRR